MKRNITFSFAGKFYLKILLIGMGVWVGLNLLLGNGPVSGQYYLPVFVLFILLFQYSYQLNIRREAAYIKRLGMGTKVNLNDIESVNQENRKLILHMSDAAQHHIPFSRFSPQDQTKILEMFETGSVEDHSPEKERQENSQEGCQEDAIPEHMLQETAKRWVGDLLGKGMSKKNVFERLRDRGVPDNKLAKIIASATDEILCTLHGGMNNIFITLFMLMSALSLWGSYVTAEPHYQIYTLVIGVLINGLFLVGFLRFSLIAYNLYIGLSIISTLPELYGYIATGAIIHLVGVVVSLCIIGFVWFIRTRLYPDYRLMGVKKDKGGEYVFSD